MSQKEQKQHFRVSGHDFELSEENARCTFKTLKAQPGEEGLHQGRKKGNPG